MKLALPSPLLLAMEKGLMGREKRERGRGGSSFSSLYYAFPDRWSGNKEIRRAAFSLCVCVRACERPPTCVCVFSPLSSGYYELHIHQPPCIDHAEPLLTFRAFLTCIALLNHRPMFFYDYYQLVLPICHTKKFR